MTEFQHFPMTMAHPGYKPSQALPIPGTEKRDAQGHPIPGSSDFQGTPERLPPVTVIDAEQQEYYEAQGYRPAGHSDPSAYAQAHASPAPPDYEPQEYPKWIAGVLVSSVDEERALDFPDAVRHASESEQPARRARRAVQPAA